jgi:nucleoid-associated protein YgaU
MILQHSWWDGTYQGTAAIGLRHPIARGMDLDLTAFYAINSPQDNPLNSVGVRVGLAFPSGGENTQVFAKNTTHPETPSANPIPEAISTKTVSAQLKNNHESQPESIAAATAPVQSHPTAVPPGEQGQESSGSETSDSNHTYIVKKGDSLWGISHRFCGYGHGWKKIYAANGNDISNPDLIHPRLKLNIPECKEVP